MLQHDAGQEKEHVVVQGVEAVVRLPRKQEVRRLVQIVILRALRRGVLCIMHYTSIHSYGTYLNGIGIPHSPDSVLHTTYHRLPEAAGYVRVGDRLHVQLRSWNPLDLVALDHQRRLQTVPRGGEEG